VPFETTATDLEDKTELEKSSAADLEDKTELKKTFVAPPSD
jgi:hypothetical protein